MGHVYGFIGAAVFPLLFVISSVILLCKRNIPQVKGRKPLFITIQNVGSAISFFLLSLCIFNNDISSFFISSFSFINKSYWIQSRH